MLSDDGLQRLNLADDDDTINWSDRTAMKALVRLTVVWSVLNYSQLFECR